MPPNPIPTTYYCVELVQKHLYHRTEVKYKEEVELSLEESVEKRKAYLNAQFSQDGDN